MKNQDKIIANYTKQFTKKKDKLAVAQIEDFENSEGTSSFRYKFCEKDHRPDKYWQLQAECYYCHKIDHIVKFCKKKSSFQAILKRLVTYIQNLLSNIISLKSKTLASCLVNIKCLESSI